MNPRHDSHGRFAAKPKNDGHRILMMFEVKLSDVIWPPFDLGNPKHPTLTVYRGPMLSRSGRYTAAFAVIATVASIVLIVGHVA